MKRICCWFVLSVLFCGVTSLHADQPNAAKKARRPDPALATIEDAPGLPRVLLIGDSISIGYTIATRDLLKGVANVHRIPANGGPTINGTAKIDSWLGDGKWDVIHFNWGLHDLKTMDGKHQVPIDQYETNLRSLVERMKKTGATLVWCSTTPVPAGELNPPRKDSDVIAFNAAAKRVMDANGVVTNDLYAFALPQLEKIQRPQNVHFSPEGSAVLAKQVASEIRKALEVRAAAKK